MDSAHIIIRENDLITHETELASDREVDQKKDNTSHKLKKKILGKKRLKELREFLMHYNDQYETEIFRIGTKSLSAPDLVGSIGTSDGLSVEILPKIDLAEIDKDTEATRKIFNRMLFSYFRKARKIDDVHSRAYKDMPPLEFLIFWYLEELALLVRRGLAHAYVEQEDNLPVFKGKLDVMKQLRHNFIHKERFYVRYDEFTADRPINRLLKAALRTALQTAKYAENRRAAMQLLPHFDVVRDVQDWRTEEQRTNLQRRTKDHYDTPQKLALLILKIMHPSSWYSNEKLYSLLFRMYDVFEAYVADTLTTFAHHHSYTLRSQETEYVLMEEKNKNARFKLQPDVVIRLNSNRTKFKGDELQTLILDTKWKWIINESKKKEKSNISRSDLYQLYAYGKRYEQVGEGPLCLVLLYPQNKNFKEKIRLEEPNGNSNSELILYLVPVDLHTALGKDPLPKTKEILRKIIRREQKAAA